MISAIALVDLDDTLFQTRRKCPAELDPAALTPMAFDAAGAPLGFATPAQAALLRWLEATCLVVPVTARSVDALRRTVLRVDLAVAAHGGAILRGGALCPAWHAEMAGRTAAVTADLAELEAAARATAERLGIGVRAWVIGEAGLPLYLVIKHARPEGCDPELHAVAEALSDAVPAGWTTHVNGNNVALLPPFLGKRAAAAVLAEELRARHPGLPLIGIGDSLTDAPFMALCDFAMTPPRSQLGRALLGAAAC